MNCSLEKKNNLLLGVEFKHEKFFNNYKSSEVYLLFLNVV